MLLTLYPGGNVRWGQDDAAKAGVISFAYATNTNNTYYGTPDPYCPARDRQADMVNILPDPAAPRTDRQGNKPERSASKVCLLVDNWVPVWEGVDPARNKGPHNDASNILFMDGHVESRPTGTWGELHPPLQPLQ
jgi:prepilin-type processing-associated H-X9-DG protein